MGGPASGTVLTLIVVTGEAAAVRRRPRGQPCGPGAPQPRILAVITRRPKSESTVGRRDPGGRDRTGRDDPCCTHVRPARAARRLRGGAAVGAGRPRRHLVARRRAARASRRSARQRGPAPGDGTPRRATSRRRCC